MRAQAPEQRGAQQETARIGGGGGGADPRDAPVEHIDIEQHRGNVHRIMGNLDRAAADYGEAIKVAPTDARGWRNRGMIRLMKYDNAGGIADYDKALEYDPKDAYSWNNRGIARRDTGDKAGAIADFKKALELNPNMPSTRQALQELGEKP